MDAVKFFKEKDRKYESHTIYLDENNNRVSVEQYVKSIEDWSNAHPIKTRQSEFMKLYPDTRTNHGVINICPRDIDVNLECKPSCYKCRKEYWGEEVK